MKWKSWMSDLLSCQVTHAQDIPSQLINILLHGHGYMPLLMSSRKSCLYCLVSCSKCLISCHVVTILTKYCSFWTSKFTRWIMNLLYKYDMIFILRTYRLQQWFQQFKEKKRLVFFQKMDPNLKCFGQQLFSDKKAITKNHQQIVLSFLFCVFYYFHLKIG